MTADLIAGHRALDARAVLPLLLDEGRLDTLARMGSGHRRLAEGGPVTAWALSLDLELWWMGTPPAGVLASLPGREPPSPLLQRPLDCAEGNTLDVPPPDGGEQLWLEGMAEAAPRARDVSEALALPRGKPRDLAFIDLETTGLDPARHEILEIGVVQVDATTLAERESTEVRVRPSRIDAADPVALRVNGYSEHGWRKAVDLAQALEWVAPVLEGTTLCGHNVGFDRAFLDAAWRHAGVAPPELDHHALDTATLAWPLLLAGMVDSLSLSAVCDVLGIELGPAHRALTDARRSLEVARRLLPGARERAMLAAQSAEGCSGRCSHGCA